MTDASKRSGSLLHRQAPDGYLEAWREVLARPAEESEDRFDTVMVFVLGTEQLALTCQVFQAVLPLRPVRTVPHRSGGVLRGLVNLDGRLEACISLAHLLAMPPSGPPDQRLLVIGNGGKRYAFGVPQVLGLRALRQDEVKPGSEGHPGYASATFEHQGAVTALLDADRVLQGLARGLLA